jgi:uncharacterized protein YndB with AHSA1/START domain
MEFEIELERFFPHPIEEVWQALTRRKSLAAWLMETDFEPVSGRPFTMWCENEAGETDTYHCRLVELDAPHRMVWSWVLAGRESEGEMRVEFHLREQEGGTLLTLRHSGDRDRHTIERFRSGWPSKIATLEATI